MTTDPDSLDWWTKLFSAICTDQTIATHAAHLAAENETLKRRAAHIPNPTPEQREQLLRSLAHAIRTNKLDHAHTLAAQETETR